MDNVIYLFRGGEVKIVDERLRWKVELKVGLFDNVYY